MSEKSNKQSCVSCKWSKWELTEKGNIRRSVYGTCTAKFVEPILPDCICRPSYHRVSIWADYGESCQLYQLKIPVKK